MTLAIEIVTFALLLLGVWLKEILDLPHLFGAEATPINWTEMVIESLIVISVAFVALLVTFRIESARRRAERIMRQQTQELGARQRITETMLSTLDLEARLDVMLQETMALLGAKMAWIALEEGEYLILKAQQGWSDAFVAQVRSIAVNDFPHHEKIIVGWQGDTGLYPAIEAALRREGVRSWVSVPLKVEGRLVGIFLLASPRQKAFSQNQIRILSDLAAKAALMIEHARLYRSAQERLARLTTLREIDRAISANLSLHEVIETLLEKAHPHMQVDAVGLSLMDWERKCTVLARLHLPDGVTIEGEAFGMSDSLLHELGVEKKQVIIYDVGADPRVQNHRGIIRKYHLRSYLGVPMIVQDEAIGVLHLFTTTPRTFSDEDVRFFATLAGQAAISVQNARLYEAAVQRAAGMESLAQLTLNLSEFGYEEELAKQVLISACEVTGATMARYYTYDQDAHTLKLAAIVGFPEEDFPMAKEKLVFPLGQEKGIVGLVGYTRKALYVPDRSVDPRFANALDPTLRTVYCLPLYHGECLFGVYTLLAREVDAFTDEQRVLAHTFATYVSTALENARLLRETQRAYEELRTTQKQLLQAQKMEAVGTLAGGVAHDFNNLLTAIQGYTEMVMMGLDKDDPAYHDLREVQRAAVRATNLTRQLLLFSRRQPMEMIPLGLNETIEDMMKMLERVIGEDISITTELEDGLWTIEADPGNIEQVIMNLVVNARDAMPEGGRIRIKTENLYLDDQWCKLISFARPGNFVCLTIEDTGTGMDDEVLEHLFEPFFTTKPAGKGTGLGLSVVYGIVTQHQGWINVYSKVGQGSTFKVYLPAVSLKPETAVERQISLEAFRGQGERILLVEDEATIRKLSTRALRESGYTPFPAANVAEALVIFERENGDFALVFSDVVLPDGSGLNLVDHLLACQPDLRVLLSSGYTDPKSQWQAICERGFPFLRKPYALSELLRSVSETMHSR